MKEFFNCRLETANRTSPNEVDRRSSIPLRDREEDENGDQNCRSRTDFLLYLSSFRAERIVVSRVDFVTFCLQKYATFYVRAARMAQVAINALLEPFYSKRAVILWHLPSKQVVMSVNVSFLLWSIGSYLHYHSCSILYCVCYPSKYLSISDIQVRMTRSSMPQSFISEFPLG